MINALCCTPAPIIQTFERFKHFLFSLFFSFSLAFFFFFCYLSIVFHLPMIPSFEKKKKIQEKPFNGTSDLLRYGGQ